MKDIVIDKERNLVFARVGKRNRKSSIMGNYEKDIEY